MTTAAKLCKGSKYFEVIFCRVLYFSLVRKLSNTEYKQGLAIYGDKYVYPAKRQHLYFCCNYYRFFREQLAR